MRGAKWKPEKNSIGMNGEFTVRIGQIGYRSPPEGAAAILK